jgi:hypothetical protein
MAVNDAPVNDAPVDEAKVVNGQVQARDTGPMSSKKFLAYLIAELTSKVLLGMGLYVLKEHLDGGAVGLWWWMITLTVCVTFLEVGAILGIAYVDKFVRVAQITANQNPFKKPDSPGSDSTSPKE